MSVVRGAFGKALLAGLLCAVILAPSAAHAATFQGLGALPGDASSVPFGVSADGSVVVGQSCGGPCHAFRWTAATGMVNLGALAGDNTAFAFGVNADGTVVVGQSCNASTCSAFRWTAGTGMVSLGTLPGDSTAEATGVSADGSVVVGTSAHLSFHAFRWTAATGMVNLGVLPGDTGATAAAVNADGSVVVGQGLAAFGSHAFRWTAATGLVSLGTLPGDTAGGASAVSADGSVVVGTSQNNMTGQHAFRWTAATGLVHLVPGSGQTQSRVDGVDADGSVAVGQSLGTTLPDASRWTSATDVQSIAALLTQAGVDLSGWLTLGIGRRTSADGNTIIGNGTETNGHGQGWIASFGTSAGTCTPLPAATALAAAILPASRSVMVGTTATAFATIINGGSTVACAVGIALATSVPATFTYNATDCATNAVTGGANVPVNIPVGAPACYVIAITPSAPFDPTDLTFAFGGSNTVAVAPITGVNTLLMSASATPVPDIVALAATPTSDGIVDIPGPTGTGAFVVATVNLGLGAPITVSADTGSAVLPITIVLCQTNPTSGACTSPVDTTVTTQINTNDTPTFAVFVQGQATVPFDPANNRVFVRFKDAGGVTRGATSVAVRTQ